MKTIGYIQSELKYGHVFTYDKFVEYVKEGLFIEYDGVGYLHDGENETSINVMLSPKWLKAHRGKYPYVVWFNR